MRVHQIVNTPIPSNCYVVYDGNAGDECVIVDPGSRNSDSLIAFLHEEQLIPKYIVLTHEHFDHCWGVNDLLKTSAIPIVCTALCSESIQSEKRNCSVFYSYEDRFTIKTATIRVEDIGWELSFGKELFRFIPSPGHTDAGLMMIVGNYVFTGDTLLKDNKTIVTLPTGSKKKLMETIDMISSFKGRDFLVFPGHGESFGLDEYDLTKSF